ncbi:MULTISPECIES: hypothetical protein [unclassified Caulobacter]|uniref:hypothetical protein n=1 Tax=unclassified Caulobacter TaxID=2648921 RepID=UPI001304FB5A|nr:MULTISPECIES: hypothetical protein [unclassified Caulobacter]
MAQFIWRALAMLAAPVPATDTASVSAMIYPIAYDHWFVPVRFSPEASEDEAA